jgi:hypothetical protein
MSIFEVDVTNMRKIMAARDRIFIIREMVQNAWDEDITRVDILLTPPDENGHSVLKVTDDSSTGWLHLDHAYTMYAESAKANDPTKRGRFNEGEKAVLCLALEASVTTMSGQICFDRERRWVGDRRRKRGSEFYMKFELTEKEYFDVCRKSRMLIPPRDITTVFNGVEIPKQAPFQMFDARLRTPINGRNEPRKAEVRLYTVRPGDAWLYEMGIPVVELGDDKWSINVMQKVPVGRDRNNVPPNYIGELRVAVFNKFWEKLSPEDASLLSVQAAAAHPKSLEAAVKANMKARFGEKHAFEDQKDTGANEEFVSQGGVVIQRNDVSKEMKKRLNSIRDEDDPKKSFVKKTGDLTPTTVPLDETKKVLREKWSIDTVNYVALIERLAPRLIGRTVKAVVIHDDESEIQGCFKYVPGEMAINLAHHDTSDQTENFDLLVHEFAHNTVKSNEHLKEVFYNTCTEIAGKLAVLALEEPELFSRWHGETYSETEMSVMSEVAE